MRHLFALAVLLFSLSARAGIHTEALQWSLDDTRFSGHLVYPEGADALPGVLMVPNWMGVNASALDKAKAIAERGYVVLLADVYGETVRPQNAEQAAAAAQEAYSDRERLRRRTAAALEQLRAAAERVPLDRSRLAAIGFCFGGATALELARGGADVAAVVSFHGNLGTPLPATKGAVKAQLLVLNGADDSYVSADSIAAFQQEMTAAGADWQFVNFAGAVHCFAEADANSAPGCLYHERSARRAYRMMDEHLREAFAR